MNKGDFYMKIIVLGGGLVGGVIAKDLAKHRKPFL
jgi:saccharopine dehydrogenase-like NADP-dependent oxidoreductase